MNRRAALLLSCLLMRQALAQEAPAQQPPATGAAAEKAGSFEDLATTFLSSVAACRSNAYPGGDPQLVAYKVTGRLLEPEADVRALLDAAVPWTKKGRPWGETTCTALRDITAQL